MVEWDERKRLSNLDDHGVDFRDAALVFESAFLEAEDRRTDYGEPRFRALGHVGDEYFMVVYTWRGEHRRIISAWKVDDDGKRRYQAILARKPPG
ncbi:MAG: BrnT family toxin [Rhodospirillales bacterium]|nr:BrnT family toxin [Rhodospirillales bacterium]